MGLTVNRQTVKKGTVNGQNWNILTVNHQFFFFYLYIYSTNINHRNTNITYNTNINFLTISFT